MNLFRVTYTHTQPFYGSMDFVWDILGESVPEETFTQSHLLWSSIIPYLLHLSTTIHGILLFNLRAWQSFSHNLCQVFFGLPLGLAPSTSYSIHFFTQSLSSFCNTCPFHRNLFCCSTKIMSSNPSLSLTAAEIQQSTLMITGYTTAILHPPSGTTRASRHQNKHPPSHIQPDHQPSLMSLSSTTIHSILCIPTQSTCSTVPPPHNLSPVAWFCQLQRIKIK